MKVIAVTEVDVDTSPIGTQNFYLDRKIGTVSVLERTLRRLQKSELTERIWASLTEGREVPNFSASTCSGGSLSPGFNLPSLIKSRICSTIII